MENGLVAIILVNYNGFDDTVECIKSIEAVNYPNYKIIVVDNASTMKPSDQQIEYITKNSTYIEAKKNLGFSSGNNIGIEKAKEFKPKYYLLLNNDTVVSPDFLTILVKAAEENENVGIVTGKINFFSEPSRIWFGGGSFDYKIGVPNHDRWNAIDGGPTGEVKDITFASGCLMLIPYNIIDDYGMLDESFFLYAEDTEYCCRILKANKRILYCEDALIYHKVNSSTSKMSVSSQYYMTRNNLYVATEYGNNRFQALRYSVIDSIKHVLKGRAKLGVILRAYIDYAKNITGEYKKK